MKLFDLIEAAVSRLTCEGIDTPRLDAEVLLCHLLKVDRIQLHIYPEREISREICHKFWHLIEKRLKRMPIQYIVNRQEFMGLDFFVEEGVLIPRGDTEILVEEVLKLSKLYWDNQLINVVDIGTGSGAITVSLAAFIDKVLIYSIDISEKALETAKKNAVINGVDAKIKFILGDKLSPLTDQEYYNKLHIIASNPPYIRSNEIDNLSQEVKLYEPRLALDGGNDGLDFYNSIALTAKDLLLEDGWLVFEIGFDQGEAVRSIMVNNGYRNVEVRKDLAGLDRVVKGRRGKD